MKTNKELLKDKDGELDLIRYPDTFKAILSIMDEAVKINKEKMVEDMDYHFEYMVCPVSLHNDDEGNVVSYPKSEIFNYLQELRNNL